MKTGAPELTIVFEVAGQPEYVSLSQAVRQLEPGVRQVAPNELVLRIHLNGKDGTVSMVAELQNLTKKRDPKNS